MSLTVAGVVSFLAQRRWAFGLACFSAGLVPLLPGFLLGRLILTSRFGYTDLVDTFALAGDISVGTAAFNLYKKSAAQFNDVLKNILTDATDTAKHAAHSSVTGGRN